MVWYYMMLYDILCIWYDIILYLLQLSFYPVAVVGKLVPKQGTAQKWKQYTEQFKNTEYTN